MDVEPGGLGSDLTLADVENPPVPAFLHARRLCRRDSDFPVFPPTCINTLVTFQVLLFSAVMLLSLLLCPLSLENRGEQILAPAGVHGCLTDPDPWFSEASRETKVSLRGMAFVVLLFCCFSEPVAATMSLLPLMSPLCNLLPALSEPLHGYFIPERGEARSLRACTFMQIFILGGDLIHRPSWGREPPPYRSLVSRRSAVFKQR